MTTMSAWPPAKAANWSKGLLASILMLLAASHCMTVPESFSHSQIGAGARARRIRTGSDSWLPAACSSASGEAVTAALPPPSPPQAATRAAAATSATRALGAGRPATGCLLPYPAARPAVLAGSIQSVVERMQPQKLSTHAGSALSTLKRSAPLRSADEKVMSPPYWVS